MPAVEVTLRDPDGDVIDLDDSGAVDYDVDGFVGTSIGEVQIETEGDHVLTVAPVDGDTFAVAVGRPPDQGVALLRGGAVAAAIGGLVARRAPAGAREPSPARHAGAGRAVDSRWGRLAVEPTRDSRFRRRRPGPPDHQVRPTPPALPSPPSSPPAPPAAPTPQAPPASDPSPWGPPPTQ